MLDVGLKEGQRGARTLLACVGFTTECPEGVAGIPGVPARTYIHIVHVDPIAFFISVYWLTRINKLAKLKLH